MAGYWVMKMFGLVCLLNRYYVQKGIAQSKVIFLNWSAVPVPFLIRSALWRGVATWTLLLPRFLSQITAIHFHHHYIFLIYHVFFDALASLERVNRFCPWGDNFSWDIAIEVLGQTDWQKNQINKINQVELSHHWTDFGLVIKVTLHVTFKDRS